MESYNPKIKLYQKRDLGDTLNAAFSFLRLNSKPFLTAMLRVAGPFALVYVIAEAAFGMGNLEESLAGSSSLGVILINLSNGLFTLILGLAVISYIKLYQQAEGTEVATADVWRETMSHLGSAIGVSILYGLAVGVGFIFILLPGIYLAVRFMLIMPFLVTENIALDSFSRSSTMVKDNWWRSFGLGIVLLIIMYAVALVFTIPAVLFFGADALFSAYRGNEISADDFSTWKYVLVAIFSAAGTFLGYSILYSGLTFYMGSLVEEKESKGLMAEIESDETATPETEEGDY